ncbi:glycosyltransferase family 4 protein [Nocardioides pantholopis]|uniref:glycosyltransferase family 4 protein n=1 Tax=Nocardioides pantholopis TaxID=2483798 RepID=UPI0013E3A543|nr:glycosyltransferase family 4 protein [Nocardioides pantholopis]
MPEPTAAERRPLPPVWRRRDRARAQRRRRVTILAKNAYGTGGIPRTIFLVANELAARGHAVEVLSVYRLRQRPYVEVHPDVRLSFLVDRAGETPAAPLPRPRRDPAATERDRELDRRPSELAEGIDEVLSALTDRLLRERLKALPPGIVLATRPALAVAAARWAHPDALVVTQEHMTHVRRLSQLKRALREVGDRLDAFTTLTTADLDRWRAELGPTPARLAVIPNATPFAVTEPAPLTAPVIISAGRLATQKAFDRLVEAFAPVAAAHPDWELHIYGSGPERPVIERRIAELGLVGRARLMGFTDDMEGRLREASAYAMSSRYEGLPMVLLEAMSTGLPPVSLDCPEGPRQLIVDGVNGLLVGREDIAGLSRALLRVVEDPALRRRLGAEAMETARGYGLAAVVDQWEALFDDLDARRGRTRMPRD